MAKKTIPTKPPVTWQTYEEVANYVVEQVRTKFGLFEVEGKQKIGGLLTGTEWEIDGKGIASEDGKFLIIEARRHMKSGLSQESVAGVAFRIIDTEAKGAITVSPLPLQEGAEKVANATNIEHIKLDAASTKEQWIAEVQGVLNIGFTENLGFNVKEKLEIRQFDKDGNLISETIISDLDDE